MCRTMKELENVVADYREMKVLLDEVSEQVKALEREIIGYLDTNQKITETGKDFTVKVSTCEHWTARDLKQIQEVLQSISGSVSIAACMSSKNLHYIRILPTQSNGWEG